MRSNKSRSGSVPEAAIRVGHSQCTLYSACGLTDFDVSVLNRHLLWLSGCTGKLLYVACSWSLLLLVSMNKGYHYDYGNL